MPTYFLTGANRGIGLEFVRQLAPQPSTTIIAAVRSKSDKTVADLTSLNTSHNIHIIECDASSPDSLSSLSFRVAEILSRTGSNLDYIFNIAGINATSTDTSLTFTSESLAQHMQTNVFGPASIVQSLARYLVRGSIVLNMTSGLGSLTVATDVTKCCTYSMSKAALNMLTLHQAKDLKAQGVKVVCMDPGWVKTRMGGKGAMIEAEVSVGSMLDVVKRLGEGASGRYLRYDGGEVPW
jgi:NAD(P)-dependent dehydrogenase (short-subunit alcohol dehydrogenase family)